MRVYIDKDAKDASAIPVASSAVSDEPSDEIPTDSLEASDGLGDGEASSSQSGASIEDCSKVSRALSEKLEAMEDQIPGGAYDLEVSSPGLERVLKEPWHFEKVIGKKISVKSFQPLSQFNENVPELGIAKQIQGKLVSFDEKGVHVSFETASKKPMDQAPIVFVPFESVTKAHVVFEFVDPSEKKAGPKKGHPSKKKPKASGSDSDVKSGGHTLE